MSVHTHKGHCQLCDRLQAVNNKTGLLAKHGYTKQWSYFSGTCPGSDHRPYEKSCDQIPPRIPSIEASIKQYEMGIESVKDLAVSMPSYGCVSVSRPWPKDHPRIYGVGPREESHSVPGVFIEHSREHGDGYDYVRTKFVLETPVTFKNGDIVTEMDPSDLYRSGHFYGCHEPSEYAAKWREGQIAVYSNHLFNNIQYRDWLVNRVAKWAVRDLVPAKPKA